MPARVAADGPITANVNQTMARLVRVDIHATLGATFLPMIVLL
ncbi:MAG: hypothetical protein WA005_00235 [Candidatus Binataceae bacterium]